MHSDLIKDKTKRTEQSEFSANGRVNSVLNFLENHLYDFTINFELSDDVDEWKLNEELFCFLDTYSRQCFFQFIPEYKYKNNCKPDFGIKEVKKDSRGLFVYDPKSEHFFDIECKRLYNPKIKEYVHGKAGGIQRFKENKHGVDLAHSAMIGYVETNDFDFWHEKVNSWIPDQNEYLKIIKISKIAKIESKHSRTNSQNLTIELTHFWLKMKFINN